MRNDEDNENIWIDSGREAKFMDHHSRAAWDGSEGQSWALHFIFAVAIHRKFRDNLTSAMQPTRCLTPVCTRHAWTLRLRFLKFHQLLGGMWGRTKPAIRH